MENTYEEEIVREACKRLERTKGIQIEVIGVFNKGVNRTTTKERVPIILMSFKMGEDKHNQIMSCEQDTFHNVLKASELPFVSQLVKRDLLKKLDERSFIVLCFAAWIYKLGKAYKYF